MKEIRKMAALGVNIAVGRGGLHAGQKLRFNSMQKRTFRIAKLKRAGAEVKNLTQTELVARLTGQE